MQANVLLADDSFTLVYANPKAVETLRDIEDQIQESFGVGVEDCAEVCKAASEGYRTPFGLDLLHVFVRGCEAFGRHALYSRMHATGGLSRGAGEGKG